MGIETLESNINVKIDEKEVSFTDIWKSGSLIEINIRHEKDWLYSILEIRDSNYNLRLMSKKSGEHHLIKSLLPNTFKRGKWKFILKIKKNDRTDIFQRDFIVNPKNYSGTLGTNHTIPIDTRPTKIDTMQYSIMNNENYESDLEKNELSTENSNDPLKSETSETNNNTEIVAPLIEDTMDLTDKDDKIADDNITLIEEKIEMETNQFDSDGVGPSTLDTTKEIDTQLNNQNSFIEAEDKNWINLANQSNDNLTKILNEIQTYDDLLLIKTIKLEEEEIINLSIPLAEIIEFSQPYYHKLIDEKINYVYQIIIENPEKIFRISDTNLTTIKSWYLSAYKIYNNLNHPLRKEYTKISEDFIKYKQIVNSLKDTSKIKETLNCLISIKPENIAKLNDRNIFTIADLFQFSILDLVNLNIDEKNPLVPKLWIANAKSFVGLN